MNVKKVKFWIVISGAMIGLVLSIALSAKPISAYDIMLATVAGALVADVILSVAEKYLS